MTRLFVLVEGQTEETFVKEALAPHLRSKGYTAVFARLFAKPRTRPRDGGIPLWHVARRDIVRHLHKDQRAAVALMVDYYRLPRSKDRGWPGRSAATGAVTVEQAIGEDIASAMKRGFDRGRFLPCVMMHEFEALLFSDCEAFGRAIERPDIGRRLQDIRNRFANPEEIDDSPVSAPSKRIKELVPDYEKVLMGNLAVLEIGLDKIRAECPHFRSWLERLEARGSVAV